MTELSAKNEARSEGVAQAVYVLLLIGVVVGVLGIVAVVVASIYKKSAPDWLHSHYRFQIRTFWIGTVLMIGGVVTLYFLVGYLVLLFGFVWVVMRCVKGMRLLAKSEAHPNPAEWLF